MIPHGWVLVPLVPSERMLTEFSGVWAPWLPRDRRHLELEAYKAMLRVVPTAPTEDAYEIVALRGLVERQARVIRGLEARNKKAWEKIHRLREKVRELEAQHDTPD